MSLFLLYFDDGPLNELAGTRSSLVLRLVPQIIRHKGVVLTKVVVAISDGVASDSLRHGTGSAGPSMRKDLALLIVERLLRSHTPRLLFHIDRDHDETIDAAGHVQLAVVDLLVRVARVEMAGRSGPQGHGEGLTRGVGQGVVDLTGAEGDTGSLGDVLTIVPYDTLVTVGGAPRTGVDQGAGRRKKGNR